MSELRDIWLRIDNAAILKIKKIQNKMYSIRAMKKWKKTQKSSHVITARNTVYQKNLNQITVTSHFVITATLCNTWHTL